ncbi:OTU-like cysteine protease [Nitzschia inconspicua]|uniref:ubiquitinyl hydrolase 1 n=1 Tax=Nitzschia inconspicua TaxID=303405 RepID=A0A9K3KM24_9STRA|nr:OTU-like cysteine protease [Nitzschia inconspicua]
MRVTLTLGDRSTNDQAGQQQALREQQGVSAGIANETGGSSVTVEAEGPSESASEPRTGNRRGSAGRISSGPTTSLSNRATLKKELPAIANSSARLKTTGLERLDEVSSSQSQTPTHRTSRKRRAATSLDCLDQKPSGRREAKRKSGTTVSSTPATSSSPTSKMVSGGSCSANPRRIESNGVDGEAVLNEHSFFAVRQVGDDIRQDIEEEDPVEDPPDIPAENNPESARGDSIRAPLLFENLPIESGSGRAEAAAGASFSRRRGIEEESLEMDSRMPSFSNAPTFSSQTKDAKFAAALKKRGLEIREQDGDGNCLFRAISLQVYGDASMHGDVRKKCMDFMERDREHFSMFVTGEPFAEYIARKRMDGVHGNNPEIQAISELFNRPIEVFTPENGAKPLNIFHAEYKTDDAPIRLSYHDGNHYNAVIDPLVPTAGLGLGLPGLQPGLADKMQMAKAVAESDAAADSMELQRILKESEDDEIQRKMKESEDDDLQRAIKLSRMSEDSIYSDRVTILSDMDATYEQLEQAALEESLRYLGQGEKKRASTVATEEEMRDDSAVAYLSSSRAFSNETVAAGTAALGAASMPSAASLPGFASSAPLRSVEEYSNTVQELVMNGFELRDVLKAYDLVGDNFDDMLSLLLSNAS